MNIAAVLLAAGRSRRFGVGDKIAAPLAGIPLAHHAARALAQVSIGPRYVVCPPAVLDWPGFTVVPNDQPELGLSRSLALGVAAARQGGAQAVLIALADMPLVPATHISRLLDRFRGPDSLVASGDGARRTPPALFGADWFETLEASSGDRGAAMLLADAEIVYLPPSCLIDVDHRADLDRARMELRDRSAAE